MKFLMKLLPIIALMTSGLPAHAEIAVEFGLTAGAQGVSKNTELVTTDGVGSVDLVVDADIGMGTLHLFVEGASDAAGSVAEVVDGANLDAGTAADANGNGRLQLSELSYVLHLLDSDLAVGVQNLFAFADANSTSNAETEQFMAASLVNNPTIAMPDYTPAVVLNYGSADEMNATLMVARGTGLADNGETTDEYWRNISKEKTPGGMSKGAFALAELRIEDQDVWLSIGTWSNTREADPLAGSYINLDSAEDEDFAWSLRLGQNNDAANINGFASFSTSFANGDDALGIGIAVQQLTDPAAGEGDPTLVETYYRWQLTDSLTITPDVQLWWNANGMTAAAAGMTGGRIIVYGLRLQYGDAFTF